MTETEKLRALLAEAQSGLRCDHNRDTYDGDCTCVVCALKTRIDAALAETVADDCGWHEYLRGDAAEGDARLLLDGAGRASRTGDDDLANAALYGAAAIRLVPRLSTERDEARAEVAAAYRRGAEAMREAAVGASVERARYWAETSAAEGSITTMEDRAEEARSIADDIRDLPLPKDNP